MSLGIFHECDFPESARQGPCKPPPLDEDKRPDPMGSEPGRIEELATRIAGLARRSQRT